MSRLADLLLENFREGLAAPEIADLAEVARQAAFTPVRLPGRDIVRPTLTRDGAIATARKSNPNHVPAGSPEGTRKYSPDQPRGETTPGTNAGSFAPKEGATPEAAGSGGSTHGGAGPRQPGSWGELDSAKGRLIGDAYVGQYLSAELRYQVDSWRRNDAGHDLAQDDAAVRELVVAALSEIGVSDSWLAQATLDIGSPDADGRIPDLGAEFWRQVEWASPSEMELQPGETWPPYTVSDVSQGRLPGVPKPTRQPWDAKAVEFAQKFELGFGERVRAMDAPDDLAEVAEENLRERWEQKIPAEKFEWAEGNNQLSSVTALSGSGSGFTVPSHIIDQGSAPAVEGAAAASRAQVLASSPIEEMANLGGGVEATFVGRMGGMRVILKPDRWNPMRDAIESGRGAGREEAAQIVNQELGDLVHLLPGTTRDFGDLRGPDGKVMGRTWVQEFVDAPNVGQSVGWGAARPSELHAVALFDSIIGDQDRHSNNAKLAEKGGTPRYRPPAPGAATEDAVPYHLIPIDHGLAFPTASTGQGTQDPVRIRLGRGEDLTPDEVARVRDFFARRAAISQRLAGHISAREITAMWARVQDLMSGREVLKT